MEYMNGKPSSALSDAVDYSRILHNGVPRDELESLLREHDRAREAEISSLRRQVIELASSAASELPAASPTDSSDEIRSEVSQLRGELATAMASFRKLLSGGDGNLHEMQLASLRRQVSQLEGVLESNYQRELRIAEERESALRSEMTQMRQDLRVALETLYRMPEGEAAAITSVDFKPIEDQIAELGTSFLRLSNEQQAHSLEREGTLKAELARMRRDLLVTLEASFQLPTERVEVLDTQIALWRGQVEELQRLVLGMQDAQDIASTRHQSALQTEIQQLRQELQSTLVSAVTEVEHEELTAQRSIVNRLAERLDEHASETASHFEQLADLMAGRSSALEAEFEALRTDLQATATEFGTTQLLDVLGEREQSLAQDIASLQRGLAAVEGAVTASANQPVQGLDELGSLRDSVTALVAELPQVRAEYRSLFQAHTESLHQQLDAWQRAILDATREGRETETQVQEPAITVDAIGEMIGSQLGKVQTEWSGAQTDLYRQLVSQMAEVQADLDLVNTGLQAVQPIEHDGPELETGLLARMNQLLEHQQTQHNEHRDFISAEDLDQLRSEIQALRLDFQEALQAGLTEGSGSAVSTPFFSLDDAVREISARLEVQKAEADQIASARDATLQRELEEIHREVVSAVQQIGQASPDGGATDPALDLSVLRSDVAALRESLTSDSRSDDDELRTELVSLRQDLHTAFETWRAEHRPQQSDDMGAIKPLADRMTEFERALQASQEDQQRRIAERDEKLYSRLSELGANFSSAVADSSAAADEVVRDAWQAELEELRNEIVALAHRSVTTEGPDTSAVVELVSAMRNEMRGLLEGIRTPHSLSDASPPDQPAIQDGLTALAISIQQSTANQDRLIEVQHQTLQAAIAQMREELHTAVSSLTREGVDSFEKRQSQLRIDQLEMERNLAQLRQELVATQADLSNKKKLWR